MARGYLDRISGRIASGWDGLRVTPDGDLWKVALSVSVLRAHLIFACERLSQHGTPNAGVICESSARKWQRFPGKGVGREYARAGV